MIRKVACMERKNLKNEYLKDNLILKTDYDTIINDFEKIIFIEKKLAERDEDYKQIIPYIVILNKENRIALYKRKGNEERLHGLWSAGFGGHIEDFEYGNGMSVVELIKKSALRELQEEFSPQVNFDLKFQGIINEEVTKVGRTHIAWVFSVEVDRKMFTPSDEIEKIYWIKSDELHQYNIELWSEMAIKLITEQ